MDLFAARLKMLRKECGLSQAELGAQVGVSRATIMRLEAGKAPPTVEVITALADLWDVNILFLTGAIKPRDRYAFLPDEVRQLLAIYKALPEKSRSMLIEMARDLAKAIRAASTNGEPIKP